MFVLHRRHDLDVVRGGEHRRAALPARGCFVPHAHALHELAVDPQPPAGEDGGQLQGVLPGRPVQQDHHAVGPPAVGVGVRVPQVEVAVAAQVKIGVRGGRAGLRRGEQPVLIKGPAVRQIEEGMPVIPVHVRFSDPQLDIGVCHRVLVVISLAQPAGQTAYSQGQRQEQGEPFVPSVVHRPPLLRLSSRTPPAASASAPSRGSRMGAGCAPGSAGAAVSSGVPFCGSGEGAGTWAADRV